MIIRRLASSYQLITQPDHAALAERIMRNWQDDRLAASPRKASILRAIAQHDDGWTEIDQQLVVDGAGQLVDFISVDDELKRETSLRGLAHLSDDPYAAALVAQHRLHVYRRYVGHREWSAFFARVEEFRDLHLRAADSLSLDELLDDYRFVRAGDLASLAFCNNWTDVDPDGCGYAMHLDGTSLIVKPDPFRGQTIEMEIDARQVEHHQFASAAEARRIVAAAPVVTLSGRALGGWL